MSVKLSALAEAMKGSEIVKLGNAISARKALGEKIYNYTIGDFDPKIFPIPEKLQELILQKYSEHLTNYPPADGVLALRKAVSRFLEKRENLHYDVNEIMITSGGRPVIFTLFEVLVDARDKVIYAVPSWNNNHYSVITRAQHCLIETTPENDFMPTAADIAPHIPGATLLCLCTPQNPTGTTLPKAELEAICDLVLEENKKRGEDDKKLYVLFDQMYWTLTFGKTEHYNPVSLRPDMKEYTIFVDGISKSFASTGVRVGWSFGPQAVIGKMKGLLTHVGAWAPMAEQQAVADYLNMDAEVEAWFDTFKGHLFALLKDLAAGFEKLKTKGYAVDVIAPQAAIYLTVKLDLKGKQFKEKVLATQSDVTDFLLSEAKLALVPFSAFGAPEDSPWYRLSIGTCLQAEIPVLFEQLEVTLSQLS